MTFREILVGYPGTKSIDAHPYYRGAASRWAWRLYHHRITRTGRWILAIAGLAAFTFFVFWSLDTQTWVAALFLATPYLTSAIACFFPPDVELNCRPPSRAAIGEPFPIPISARARTRRPLFDLRLYPVDLPDGLDAVDEDGTPIGALSARETKSVSVSLVATRRGVHRFSGWRVASDFPFGLLDAYRIIRAPVEIVVPPTPARVRLTALYGGVSRLHGGPEAVSTTGESLEFSGNRPWRQGDRPRDVDWRATARHLGSADATLIVREWHKSEEAPVVVVLDLAIAKKKGKPWQPLEDPTRLVDRLAEAAVSIAAGVVEECHAQGRDLQCIELATSDSSGPMVSKGPAIAYRLAAAQATPTAEFDADQFAAQLPAGTCALVWIATLWDQRRIEFANGLRRAGLNPRVVVLVPGFDTALADNTVTPVPVSGTDRLRVDI